MNQRMVYAILALVLLVMMGCSAETATPQPVDLSAIKDQIEAEDYQEAAQAL